MAIDQAIDEGSSGRAAPPAKSGIGKMLLLVFVGLLLIGTSIGATLFLTGVFSGDAAPAADKRAGGNAAAQKPQAPPVYVELGEPFVVNFIEGNQIRYLQVRIEAMTRDPAVVQAVGRHLPRIRNNLVFMFSGFDYAALGTIAGKQKIRDEALAEVQSVLKQEIGDPGIEAIYFTSFVMQ
jgi:flagellar FliL protein